MTEQTLKKGIGEKLGSEATHQNKTLLEGWQEVVLGDVVELIIDHRGKTPKKLGGDWSNSGYRAISAKTIKNGRLVNEDKMNLLPEDLYKKWMKNEIQYGDIFLTSEAPLGEHLIWKSNEKLVLSQRIFGIRTKKEILDSFYFNYFIDSEYYQYELKSRESGSTVTGIKQTELLKTKILLPPLPQQKAIADVLSSFDDKIELLREQNKTLEKIGQELFKEWFGKYKVGDDLPEGWRVGKLGEVIEFINGYAFKSSDLLKIPAVDTYKVFKMGDIKKGGGFNQLKTKSYFKKSDAENLKKYILKDGDLLMSMTDMKDAISLLGHTALMIYNNEYIVNQRVGLIRVKNEINIEYPYLYLLTNDKDFIANLRGRANSGVQINLSTDAIKNSEIVIADKDFNKKFGNVVKPLFQKIKNNSEQIQTLSKTRDVLLLKLMRGEIVVD